MTQFNFLREGFDEKLFFQRSHIPVKEWRRFSRGQLPLQARIDLHGYTRFDAEEALDDFLEDCQEQDLQIVLVIHGKGEVLKAMVDEQLRQDLAVLAFCSATPRHGGTGAVYIYLKKNRQD